MGIDQPAGAYMQITLADTGSEHPHNTYAAIVEVRRVNHLRLSHNMPVGVTLETRSFGDLAYWFVTEITTVGFDA